MLLIVTCKLLTLILDEDQQYVSWNVEIITFDGLTLHCEMNDQICHLFKWRNDFQRWTALEEIIEWCLTKFKPVPTRYYLNVNTNWLSHMLRVKQIWLWPIPWWEGRTSLWLTLKMSAQETLCCDQFSLSTQLTKPNLSCNTPRGHAPQLLLKLIPFVFLHSWIWSVK